MNDRDEFKAYIAEHGIKPRNNLLFGEKYPFKGLWNWPLPPEWQPFILKNYDIAVSEEKVVCRFFPMWFKRSKERKSRHDFEFFWRDVSAVTIEEQYLMNSFYGYWLICTVKGKKIIFLFPANEDPFAAVDPNSIGAINDNFRYVRQLIPQHLLTN